MNKKKKIHKAHSETKQKEKKVNFSPNIDF